jgi:hypothetical protein
MQAARSPLPCGALDHLLAAATAVGAMVLIACGSGTDTAAGSRCTTDDGTGENPALATVSPAETRELTVAEVLRRDERFSRFRKLAEETETQVGVPWLENWDRPADRLGNKIWSTVFVPPDTAFAALDDDIRMAWEDGRLDNLTRYGWLGHHSVHRPYPSSAFEAGLQSNWQPTGLGRWEKTSGLSGPVDVVLTLDPLTYGGCPILQTDLRTLNGYIHVIGGVVLTDQVTDAAG